MLYSLPPLYFVFDITLLKMLKTLHWYAFSQSVVLRGNRRSHHFQFSKRFRRNVLCMVSETASCSPNRKPISSDIVEAHIRTYFKLLVSRFDPHAIAAFILNVYRRSLIFTAILLFSFLLFFCIVRSAVLLIIHIHKAFYFFPLKKTRINRVIPKLDANSQTKEVNNGTTRCTNGLYDVYHFLFHRLN